MGRRACQGRGCLGRGNQGTAPRIEVPAWTGTGVEKEELTWEGVPGDRTKDSRSASMDGDGSGEGGGDRGESARGECQGRRNQETGPRIVEVSAWTGTGVEKDGLTGDSTKDGSASMDEDRSGGGFITSV
ncbi:hypothetical protein Pcinc_043661 [Petrolisthes cinctipes]|uniref:Uncharacterized protein n=1 Tax=Petrolisthes cinctipes TaxID=88211 RepID=A0AAE1BFJ9_PETCI|nr:hypothetical protein Pcinc_043661 [Petrolisthes cinctipes]